MANLCAVYCVPMYKVSTCFKNISIDNGHAPNSFSMCDVGLGIHQCVHDYSGWIQISLQLSIGNGEKNMSKGRKMPSIQWKTEKFTRRKQKTEFIYPKPEVPKKININEKFNPDMKKVEKNRKWVQQTHIECIRKNVIHLLFEKCNKL